MKLKSIIATIFCMALFTNCTSASLVGPFDASSLKKIGDNLSYGSYVIYKLDDGIYKINDPGITTGSGGAWGVDMYLVCGTEKALMIDLGNDYINGKPDSGIEKKENAAEDLWAIINGLKGNLLLEVAFTHGHGDHTGMIDAFADTEVTVWSPKDAPGGVARKPKGNSDGGGEEKVERVVQTPFEPGKKSFDLGGGRIIETFPVRGHTNNGTNYILAKDLILFTGDALGSGFGQGFKDVKSLQNFAEDVELFVSYIKATFSPFERYQFRVYTGHTWQNVYNGYYSTQMGKVDMGYLDWRFIQNVASCAEGILKGYWLIEGSGLIHAGYMPKVAFWEKTEGWSIMVYGLGSIVIPLELAYEAAGIKMPK